MNEEKEYSKDDSKVAKDMKLRLLDEVVRYNQGFSKDIYTTTSFRQHELKHRDSERKIQAISQMESLTEKISDLSKSFRVDEISFPNLREKIKSSLNRQERFENFLSNDMNSLGVEMDRIQSAFTHIFKEDELKTEWDVIRRRKFSLESSESPLSSESWDRTISSFTIEEISRVASLREEQVRMFEEKVSQQPWYFLIIMAIVDFSCTPRFLFATIGSILLFYVYRWILDLVGYTNQFAS